MRFCIAETRAQSGFGLILDNGVIVSRYPYGDADGEISGGHGQYGASAGDACRELHQSLDKVERFYAYRRVGSYFPGGERRPIDRNHAGRLADECPAVVCFALVLMASLRGAWRSCSLELAQRQHMPNQLRQAEHYLRTILDNLPSMVSYWDSDQRNHFINKPATSVWASARALRGLREVLGEEDYAIVQPMWSRACRAIHSCLSGPDRCRGQVRHTHISYTPDRGDRRRPGTFLCR